MTTQQRIDLQKRVKSLAAENKSLREVNAELLGALEQLIADYGELWESATDDELGECDDAGLVRARKVVAKARAERTTP